MLTCICNLLFLSPCHSPSPLPSSWGIWLFGHPSPALRAEDRNAISVQLGPIPIMESSFLLQPLPSVQPSWEPSSLSALPYSLCISGPSLWLAVASTLLPFTCWTETFFCSFAPGSQAPGVPFGACCPLSPSMEPWAVLAVVGWGEGCWATAMQLCQFLQGYASFLWKNSLLGVFILSRYSCSLSSISWCSLVKYSLLLFVPNRQLSLSSEP